MKRLLLVILLSAAAARAEDAPALSGHVGFLGLGVLAGRGAGIPGIQLTPVEVEFEKGDWMFGGGGAVGAIGSGVLIGSIAVRADRFLHAGWYAGARAGWLIEEDTERLPLFPPRGDQPGSVVFPA